MLEFLINETKKQYIQMVFGVPHLFYIRQVTKIWDIYNDDLYCETRTEPPRHLKNMNIYIDRYN